MNQLKKYRKIRSWQQGVERHAPKIGRIAPDFTLTELDGSHTIRLSQFRGKKPVALIFGSHTWPPFADGTVRLGDLYQAYHQQIQFLVIYIREAHPVDGWWFGDNLVGWLLRKKKSKAAMDIYEANTTDERRAVAQRCADTLAYGIPTLVDGIDNAVNEAYAALPTRLYLIGLDGRVAYASAPGPWGFKPGQLENAIRQYLQTETPFPADAV